MRIPINQAIEFLNQGQVVAVPTETVYGLAARLDHPKAIEQIFFLKGRPLNNPLIVHLSDASQISQYVNEIPPHVDLLSRSFWPGPLTLVLPVNSTEISPSVRAGLPTAAFRIPNHSLTLELIKKTGPLVMPSANLSGRPSSTQPEHVEADFGKHFPVLDGGSCLNGIESTILFFREGRWEIIRLGALTAEAFVLFLGYSPQVSIFNESDTICPGQLHRHYAPQANLLLTKNIPSHYDGVVIGFNGRTYPNGSRILSLGSITKPEEAANSLYAILRQLDEEEIKTAYVDVDIPRQGLWMTILERLTKAAQNNN